MSEFHPWAPFQWKGCACPVHKDARISSFVVTTGGNMLVHCSEYDHGVARKDAVDVYEAYSKARNEWNLKYEKWMMSHIHR